MKLNFFYLFRKAVWVPGHSPVRLRGKLHQPGPAVHRDQPQHEPRHQDQGAVRRPPLRRGQAASRRRALQGMQCSQFTEAFIFSIQGSTASEFGCWKQSCLDNIQVKLIYELNGSDEKCLTSATFERVRDRNDLSQIWPNFSYLWEWPTLSWITNVFTH